MGKIIDALAKRTRAWGEDVGAKYRQQTSEARYRKGIYDDAYEMEKRKQAANLGRQKARIEARTTAKSYKTTPKGALGLGEMFGSQYEKGVGGFAPLGNQRKDPWDFNVLGGSGSSTRRKHRTHKKKAHHKKKSGTSKSITIRLG